MSQHRRRNTLLITCTGIVLASMSSNALAQQAQTPRVFDAGNSNPNPFVGPSGALFDWTVGESKAQCLSGGPVVGISAAYPSYQAHSVLCQSPVPNRSVPFYQGNPPVAFAEKREDFGTSTSADWGHHPVGGNTDWDIGALKGECPVGSFVTGVAQTTSGVLDKVWCSQGICEPAYTSNLSCHVVKYPGSNPWPSAYGEWALGFEKLVCNSNEVMVGLSANATTHHPHAILCCGVDAIIC